MVLGITPTHMLRSLDILRGCTIKGACTEIPMILLHI